MRNPTTFRSAGSLGLRNVPVPEYGELFVRMADNVMPDDLLPVWKLTMKHGRVRYQELVWPGIYSNNFAEATCAELQEWLDYDSTGTHPEQYNERVFPA